MSFAAIVRRYGLLALGAIGIVVGVVLLTRVQTMSFRWSAYAPLTNTIFVPPFITGDLVLGVVLLALGVGLAAGWVGFVLGRRRKASQDS